MNKTQEIVMDGIATIPESVTAERFCEDFLLWMESKGYTYGGRIDAYPITVIKDESVSPEESSPISEGLRVDFDINNPDRVTPTTGKLNHLIRKVY